MFFKSFVLLPYLFICNYFWYENYKIIFFLFQKSIYILNQWWCDQTWLKECNYDRFCLFTKFYVIMCLTRILKRWQNIGFWSSYMQKTARLAGRLIFQEGPRTFWGGAPPQEVLGPTSEGPRSLLGYWNLLIYLPIWQFFECMPESIN